MANSIKKTKNAKQVYMKEANEVFGDVRSSSMMAFSLMADSTTSGRNPFATTTNGRNYRNRNWSITPDITDLNRQNLGPLLVKRTSRDHFERKKQSV